MNIIKPVKNFFLQLRAALILLAFFGVNHFATAQSVWNGTNNVSANTNWSSAVNWLPNGVPGATSNVVFNDRGAAAAPGVIDNVVDVSTTIQQLAYRQTNGVHNTFILPGVTLTISNAGTATNLLAGSESTGDPTTLIVTNTISGAGGTLAITSANTGSSIVVRQITGGVAGSHLEVLDMSGLDNFNAAVGNVLIGVLPGNATTRPQGVLFLAKTNIISVLTAGTAATPSIDVGDTGGSPDVNNILALGITNGIAADTIEIANQRSGSTLYFNPAFTNGPTPSLYLRGHASSRVATFNIGDDSVAGGVGSSSSGAVDFSGGTVDAMVDSMAIGNGQTAVGTGTATGKLTMTAGTFNVNTMEVGFEGVSGAVGLSTGTVNINGGTLTLNTSLRLAHFLGGTIPIGTLNIRGGVMNGNGTIIAGGGNSTINLSSATLAIGGAIGASATPISTFNATNSTLSMVVGGAANIAVTSLNLGGGNSTINITSLPSIASYPALFPLVTYATEGGESAFTLGSLPGTFAGTLTDDHAGTYTLTITSGPPPSKNVSWNGNVNGNWDVSTLNWLTSGSPSAYSQGDFVTFDDSLTGTTNVNLTTALNPGSITFNNNSATYVLSGSGKLGGNVGLVMQGGGTVVIDNSGTNDFLGSVAINAGTLQIGNNDGNGNLPALATVTDNNSLVFDRSNNIVVLNTISGSGTVNQNNTNTVTLGGGNSYNGGLNVNAGTLRLTAATGQGNGPIALNANGTLVAAVGLANPITLTGGALGASASVTYAGDLTASDSTTNIVYTIDPQNPGTALGNDSILTGTLHGSGVINVITGTNTPNPDAGNGLRLRGTGFSDFSGTIIVSNSAKGELQTTVTASTFSPAGSGTIILVGGTYAADGTTNGTFCEFNLRNNSSGDTTFGNNMEMAGTGLDILNLLGTAPTNAAVTMGNLKIGNNQQLGVHLNSNPVHKVIFKTVTLNGGNATLSPKVPGLGTNTVGGDMSVGDVSELVAGSSLTMGGLRTLTMTGNNTYSGDTIISSGTLALTNSTDLSNSPAIRIAAGAILDVSGRSDQTLTVTNNNLLTGNGTLNGNLVVSPGSTFAPGATGGVFTVTSGTATLEGVTLMKINRTGATQTNSTLNAGTIALGGTLTVSNLTTTPVAGDSYQLFVGSLSGSFAATNLPALGAGLAWDASTLNLDGTLRVISTAQPQPKFNSVELIGNNLVVSGTNGTASGNYYVIASTNLALPLSSWTSIATNAFSGGNFIFTNTVIPGVHQQFYLLQLAP